MKRRSSRGYIKNKFKVTAIIISFVMLASISVSSVVLAGNKKEEPLYRYYTSVEINPGDSLWSIAHEYCDGTGLSVMEYIEQIKSINHLGTDKITSGQYLIVMYASDECK